MEMHYQTGLGAAISSPRQVSLVRKVLNILGGLLSLPIFHLITVHCRWPVTLDLILTVALTELNRFVNEGRRMEYHEGACQSPVTKEKMDLEKAAVDLYHMPSKVTVVECMAAVVGWREDPSLFTRALASYRQAKGCVFLLVGIDGNETQDQEMVDVFDKVKQPPFWKFVHSANRHF